MLQRPGNLEPLYHPLLKVTPTSMEPERTFLDRFTSPLAVRPKEASDGFHTIGDVMPLTASAQHFYPHRPTWNKTQKQSD